MMLEIPNLLVKDYHDVIDVLKPIFDSLGPSEVLNLALGDWTRST